MIEKFSLLLSLTKRDYTIQYAGSILGVLWIFVQSFFFLGIYIFIAFVFNLTQFQKNTKEFLLLLSGVVFWVPLQEYILRTSTILVENRNLLKKTTVNFYFILLVPFVQMNIHFFLLCIPLYILLYFVGLLNLTFCLFGFFVLIGFGIFLFPILAYVSFSNVLLKDITPLLRIFLQFLFWSLPILYKPSNQILEIISWNPLFSFLELFRYFAFESHSLFLNLKPLVVFGFLALFFQVFANPRIFSVVLDQI